MRKLWYLCTLLGVASLSSGITAAILIGGRQAAAAPLPVAVASAARPASAPAAPAPRQVVVPQQLAGAVAVRAGRLARKQAGPTAPLATPITHGPTVTPSLYEGTTSPAVLRAQGCRAGRAGTNGLVVLDFGKLEYRPRRGGYGTLTFANRFASNRSVTWAVKSYARGYSECLAKASHAHITLALGTSNYDQDIPSTYTAGRLWAQMTASVGAYVKLHHFGDHVTAAAGDDVEPAWDRGFTRTYGFFRGFGSVHSGYLIYNYGSLDGGVVRGVWKLRQAYYVAGGMKAARAVPEIYNHSMAEQWAELSRMSVDRYGKPIKLAGLMTQHQKHCGRCGYTAAQAHEALVQELAKHPQTKVRMLASATNIGSPAPVSSADLPQHH